MTQHVPQPLHTFRAGKARTAKLWLGLLGGPLAFLVDLEISYGAIPWLRASGHKLPLYASSAVALAITATCGVFAWRIHRELSHHEDDDDEQLERERFMSLGGVVCSFFFILSIAALAVPKLGLHLWD